MTQRVDRVVRLCALGMSAWCGLLAFDLARMTGFARLHRWVKHCSINPVDLAARGCEQDVIWAVEEACVWYFKRAACLQRSVVATWLLRRRGFQASLVIGCRPIPFESHAWVEIDGRVVNDLPQYRTAFTILDRL